MMGRRKTRIFVGNLTSDVDSNDLTVKFRSLTNDHYALLRHIRFCALIILTKIKFFTFLRKILFNFNY